MSKTKLPLTNNKKIRRIGKKSKQCIAEEIILRRAKSLRQLNFEAYRIMKQKRRQNTRIYKLPQVVQKALNPTVEVIAHANCYCFGEGETCILYLHGGSYVDPPTIFHWRFLQNLLRQTKVKVVLPLYRRVPLSNCLKTMSQVVVIYKHLCNLYGAQNITIMGDSAGGGMALALCEYLTTKDYPQPSKMILLSPWLDVDMTADYGDLEKTDLMLIKEELLLFGKRYRRLLPIGHYLASPLFGLNSKIAPTHVFVGTHELFWKDCQLLKKYASGAGAKVKIYPYDNMQHVFVIHPIPEALPARQKIVDILEGKIQ